jgi:hypothetical protein
MNLTILYTILTFSAISYPQIVKNVQTGIRETKKTLHHRIPHAVKKAIVGSPATKAAPVQAPDPAPVLRPPDPPVEQKQPTPAQCAGSCCIPSCGVTL